jgi:hypothetical protein
LHSEQTTTFTKQAIWQRLQPCAGKYSTISIRR